MQEYNNTFFIEEINTLVKNDKDLLISMSESMYHEQIKELVDNVLEKKNIKIILIAGPSSSGKTTTSKLIKQYLKTKKINSISVSLDDFFLNRDKTPLLPNGNFDFENITALDIDFFKQFISDLFNKNKAKMPIFNFKTGMREENLVDIQIDDKTVVIIEGLHALNPMLVNGHEEGLYKVYICPNSNFNYKDDLKIDYTTLRLMRRLIRDYYHRNRSFEETIKSWDEVLKGEELYINPYVHLADFKVDSTHMYEVLMFAKCLPPMLKNTKSQKLIDIKDSLQNCEKLDKNIIPKNSLLNEFFTE